MNFQSHANESNDAIQPRVENHYIFIKRTQETLKSFLMTKRTSANQPVTIYSRMTRVKKRFAYNLKFLRQFKSRSIFSKISHCIRERLECIDYYSR